MEGPGFHARANVFSQGAAAIVCRHAARQHGSLSLCRLQQSCRKHWHLDGPYNHCRSRHILDLLPEQLGVSCQAAQRAGSSCIPLQAFTQTVLQKATGAGLALLLCCMVNMLPADAQTLSSGSQRCVFYFGMLPGRCAPSAVIDLALYQPPLAFAHPLQSDTEQQQHATLTAGIAARGGHASGPEAVGGLSGLCRLCADPWIPFWSRHHNRCRRTEGQLA